MEIRDGREIPSIISAAKDNLEKLNEIKFALMDRVILFKGRIQALPKDEEGKYLDMFAFNGNKLALNFTNRYLREVQERLGILKKQEARLHHHESERMFITISKEYLSEEQFKEIWDRVESLTS